MERLIIAAPSAPAKPSLDRNGNPTKWSHRPPRRPGARVLLHRRVHGRLLRRVHLLRRGRQRRTSTSRRGSSPPRPRCIVGVVCAVALAATTYLGRRALVGFVALFTFLGFSNTDFVIGLPFLLLAVWLLYRSYKVQKEVTARIKERAGRRTERRPPPARPVPGRSGGGPPGRRPDGRPEEGPARARGEQALHAEEAGAPRSPAAQAVVARAPGGQRRPTDAPPGRSGRRPDRRAASSVTRAERSSSRISLRRRTSDRAVGSSPKARSTSTSVSIPMTVE